MQEAKDLDEKGYSMREIANIMGLDRKTVKKYIESDGTYTHASTGNTRSVKLLMFGKRIIEMYSEGAKGTMIVDALKKDGYAGSESLLRHFISKINQKVVSVDDTKTEQVSRKHLISLLYKEIEKVKAITMEQLKIILGLHPHLETIYDVSRKFKELLFNQDADKLDEWIKQTSELNIPELTRAYSKSKKVI